MSALLTWGTVTAPVFPAAIPQGEPVLVSEPDSCDPVNSDLAALVGGGFVAAWTELRADQDVVARLLDSQGNPLGPPFTVHEETTGRQVWPKVVPLAEGGFAVAFLDEPRMTRSLRLFNAMGSPLGEKIDLATFPVVERGFALAKRPAGGMVAVWGGEDGNLRVRHLDGEGRTLSDNLIPTPVDSTKLIPTKIGVDDQGGVAVLSVLARPPSPIGITETAIFRLDASGKVERITATGSSGLAVLGDGRVVSVGVVPGHLRGPLFARIFDPAVAPLRDPANPVDVITIDDELDGSIGNINAVAGPPGTIAFGWTERRPDDADGENHSFARILRGGALGPRSRLRDPVDLRLFGLRVVTTSAGGLVALWREGEPVPWVPPPPCTTSAPVFARVFSIGCLENAGTLCIRDGRFGVEAAWRLAPTGPSHRATAVPLTEDTGAFWFFDPDNLELMTKVIDGTSVNDRFWFFYGALSDVGYDVTVTDFETDSAKVYSNPPGTLASVGDTRAFSAPSLRAESSSAPTEMGAAASFAPTSRPSFVGAELASALTSDCGAGRSVLCLNDERFEVTVDWTDPFNGGSGQGRAVPITDDTGSFWFFEENNLELMVKVLDGRPVNGHFWVFFGALTNIGYTVTVTDTLTGQTQTYDNPPFQFASVADTAAFE